MPGTQGSVPLDVTAMLGPERDALLGLLADLDAAEWSAQTECPAWTVKGVALHVLGDDLSLLSRQRDQVTPGLILYAEHHPGLDFRALLDGFNEQWVTAADFLSPHLLRTLLALTGDWTAAFYTTVDLLAPGEPVGFFAAAGPSPYWQISAREYVERWVHHQQIRRAVGRPDLGGEYLVPALETIVRGVAAHLPDLGAPDGRSLAIRVAGTGAWRLTREAGGWTVTAVEAEAGGAGDAELALDPALATEVLSRGRSVDGVRSAFTVSGDPALGGGALDVVARLAGQPPAPTRPPG